MVILTHRDARARHQRGHPAHRGAAHDPGAGRADPAGGAAVEIRQHPRRHAANQTFTDILLEGLAADGGLAVPEQWPRITRPKLDAMRDLAYPQLAFEILRFFADDFPGAELKALVERTYTEEVFGTPEITPLRTLEPNLHLLALLQRPDARVQGHRDAAARQPLRDVLEKQGRRAQHPGRHQRRHGLVGRARAARASAACSVFMLSPHGRMSPFQRAQMYGLQDANIFNIAVEGVFDDCQDIVKAVNADAALQGRAPPRRRELHQLGARRGAGRLLLQGLLRGDALERRAGVLRRALGQLRQHLRGPRGAGAWGCRSAGSCSPPTRTTCSTSSSAPAATARGRPPRRTRPPARPWTSRRPPTSSASSGTWSTRTARRSRGCGGRLDEKGGFDLSTDRAWERIEEDSGFVSGRSLHADRIDTIRRVKKDYGVVIDPHTADGVKIGAAHPRAAAPR